MSHKIVILRHRPGLKASLIAASAFAVLIGAFSLYRYTRATTVSDFARAQTELEQLREERRNLSRELRDARREISELKDQVTYVQRSTEIDTQSNESVRGSLASLQAEAADLREQLAFYRGIVSPELSKAGIRVYDFSLKAAAASNTYRYELVLIQSVRHERRVGGRAEVLLEGDQGGHRTRFKLDDLALGGKQDPSFSFKYFEEFGGEFRLPEGFKPAQITVTLSTDVPGAPEIKQQFEWAKALRV